MKHVLTITAILLASLNLTGVAARAGDQPPEKLAEKPATGALEPIPPHLETTISPLDKHDEIVFRMSRDTKLEGSKESVTNTFRDKDGKVVVVESAVMENGHAISFHQDQNQWDSTGDMIVKDGKVHFTYTRDGKTKTSEDNAGSDFVVTASLMNFVREHWGEIVKGKAVKFKLGVLERRELISFEIKKDKDITYSGKPAYVLKMSPSSVFISALVNPIFFTSTIDGNRLWEIDGRTPLKLKKGDDWKDFDGHTVYQY